MPEKGVAEQAQIYCQSPSYRRNLRATLTHLRIKPCLQVGLRDGKKEV